MLRFVKLCHKFQIYTRTHARQAPQPLPSLSNQVESSGVKPIPPVEGSVLQNVIMLHFVCLPDKLCPEYEGELMTIKMLKREGQGVGETIALCAQD